MEGRITSLSRALPLPTLTSYSNCLRERQAMLILCVYVFMFMCQSFCFSRLPCLLHPSQSLCDFCLELNSISCMIQTQTSAFDCMVLSPKMNATQFDSTALVITCNQCCVFYLEKKIVHFRLWLENATGFTSCTTEPSHLLGIPTLQLSTSRSALQTSSCSNYYIHS